MNKIFVIILTAAAALAFSACGSGTIENSAADPNKAVRTEKPANMPSQEELFAQEKKSWEAWKNKDEAYFKDALADNFIGFGPRGPLDKAAAIKNIVDPKCDVKSYSFSDEKLNFIGTNAAILTFKGTQDVTCGGKPQPQNVWSASVYVRDGDKWKSVYYNEVAVLNPDRPAEKLPPAAKAKSADEAKPDELTDTLLAAERRGWEAWQKRDASLMREVMANNFIYVDPTGSKRYDHDEALKELTEKPCEIKGFELSDAKGTRITDDAAILTYKGIPEGTCGGNELFPVWGTTIFMREGDKWRAMLVYENKA